MVFEIDRGGDEPPKKMRFTDKNGNQLDQQSLQKLPQQDRNVRFLEALRDEHYSVAMKYYDAGISFPADIHIVCLLKAFQSSKSSTSKDFKHFRLKLIDDYFKKQGYEDCLVIEALIIGDHSNALSYIKDHYQLSEKGLQTYYATAAMISNEDILKTILNEPNANKIINSGQILRTAIENQANDQTLQILCKNGAVLDTATIQAAIQRGDKCDVLSQCLKYGATIQSLNQKSMTLLLTLARIKSPNQALKTMLRHWPLKNVTNSVFRAITHRLERNDISHSQNSIFMLQCINQELSRRATIKAFDEYLLLNTEVSGQKKIQKIGKIFHGLTKSRHPSIGPVTYKAIKKQARRSQKTTKHNRHTPF